MGDLQLQSFGLSDVAVCHNSLVKLHKVHVYTPTPPCLLLVQYRQTFRWKHHMRIPGCIRLQEAGADVYGEQAITGQDPVREGEETFVRYVLHACKLITRCMKIWHAAHTTEPL